MATSSRKGFGCLAVVAIPFILGGAGLSAVAAHALLLYHSSADWTPVQARIERVELVESRNSDATRVDATYAYEWQGTRYRSERVGTQTGFSSDPVHAQRVAELEKARDTGATVTALIDPADPREALLFRTLQPSSIALLAGGLLFGLGGLVLLVMVLRWWRGEVWRRAREQQFPGKPWRHERAWDGGVVTSVAGARLFGVWVAAVFSGLFAAPFALFFLDGESGRAARIVAGLLVALFCLFLLLALRATLSRMKHGTATLALGELPLRPGHAVRAAVRWGPSTSPQPVRCRLRCLQSTSRMSRDVGDSSRELHTRITELYSEEWMAEASSWQRVAGGYTMPVTLAIPADGSPRTEGDATILWWFEVTLAGSGVGARHAFDLPVLEAESTERNLAAAV